MFPFFDYAAIDLLGKFDSEVFRALTEVDVIGAHEGFGLAADDDELYAVLGQHSAEPFKRALRERVVQSSAP